MHNIDINTCEKFHYDRRETTEPYGMENLITTRRTFVAIWDPFLSPKGYKI